MTRNAFVHINVFNKMRMEAKKENVQANTEGAI